MGNLLPGCGGDNSSGDNVSLSAWIFIVLIFVMGIMAIKSKASTSTRADLYKIDSRDWYFNHRYDYAINQPELMAKAEESDGAKAIRQADEEIERIERNWK